MNPIRKISRLISRAVRSIDEYFGFNRKSHGISSSSSHGPEDPPEPTAPAARPTRTPRPPHGPRSGVNPLAEAIEAATTPINDACTQIRIECFSTDGAINVDGETWHKENGTFKLTNSEIRTFNCAGGLIKPKDMKGMCLLGGKPDTVLKACGYCGHLVCLMHGRYVNAGDKEVFYCLKHVAMHLEMPFWDRKAIAEGKPLRIRPFTPAVKPVKRDV